MKRRIIKYLFCLLGFGLIAFAVIPTPNFDQPYSQVIYDKEGQLLGGQIAQDGQWRFPMLDSIPELFELALLTFEDKRFYKHHGIDLQSVVRALQQNFKAQKVVSGASTITMQVCRMSRGASSRSLTQKIIEMAMAIKAECLYSKAELLQLHVSHAPFGGNVVGLEAASWRYYSKPPEQLSLAESVMLAVLPNAPALIHPGRNRSALEQKRNRLLKSLLDQQKISQLDYELALLETIPERPKALPRLAPHLLHQVQRDQKGIAKTITTIDRNIQQDALRTAEIFSLEYQQSDIQNLAILVLDTQSGEVLAYVGNSAQTKAQHAVDMIQARRSSGSVLKPFLHAYALDDGLITPQGLVKDIPMHYNGYRPQNYNRTFAGAVKADEALAKSLNIPAVELLKRYDISRFITKLNQQGLTTINKSADHYGLSLILGSADVSLWQLTSAYAGLGRILERYKKEQSRYCATDIRAAHYLPRQKTNSNYSYEPTLISAAAIHHTFEAMQKLSRPNAEGDWESFSSSKKIAWKTGTSYGHRDAWAIGVSPRYTVGVWVGNADGEGKHSLVGVKRAAPVLFDVFNHLDYVGEFETPYDDLVQTVVCNHTGYTTTQHCTNKDTVYQITTAQAQSCPYHQSVHLDQEGYRVSGRCISPSQMQKESYMVLPADEAYYYRKNHPEYRKLPDFRKDCRTEEELVMRFIYPDKKAKIYLPKVGDGEKEAAIFKVAHQNPQSKLYWHLNDQYLGMTEGDHSMAIVGEAGAHELVLVDEDGNSVGRGFEIMGE